MFGHPGQLIALASLGDAKSTLQLANDNETPYPSMHKAVRGLEKSGFVRTKRQGRMLWVSAVSPELPALARALMSEAPRQDWRNVFRGSRPYFLDALDRTGSPELAAEMTSKARSSAYHAIKAHSEQGILVKQDGRYSINPRLQHLRRFLRKASLYHAYAQVHDVDPDATILWAGGPEALFASRKGLESSNVQEGGLSAFHRFGIDLIEPELRHYFLGTRRLDAADAILQALLASPASTVTKSYCALLYETQRPSTLDAKAVLYGLEPEAKLLRKYVDTHKAPGFMGWDQHERYREQYGVA